VVFNMSHCLMKEDLGMSAVYYLDVIKTSVLAFDSNTQDCT